MALFEAFHEPRDVDAASGTLTVADDSLIQVVAGSMTFDYYGAGFTYDAHGALLGGTLTGFDIVDSANGGVQARASLLNLDAVTFFGTAASGNEAAFDDLLFWGDDTLIGSAADDEMDGNNGKDSLAGGAGNDTLDGGNDSLVDTLVGGAGNDTYLLNSQAVDMVLEAPGEGIDTVRSPVSYVLGANVERLVLLGSLGINGTGNALDNYIEGNAGANLLEGLAGNDTLVSGTSGGIDTLRGGDGNDTYVVHDWQTVIEEAPGGGIDTVRSATDYSLPADVENLVLEGAALRGAGNSLANVITGNDLGDVLFAGEGADTLVGGHGNDSFFVDADDVLMDAGGNDTVQTSASVDNYVLPDGIETLFTQGTTATGNSSGNLIAVLGGDKSNVLFALAGNDTIVSGSGVDTIDGGDGIDHSTYASTLSDYSITRDGADVIVASRVPIWWDKDTLRNVERLDFADCHVALDIDGNAGRAYRLYKAAFDRPPDLGGLGYQINDLDHVLSFEQVAGNFIASPEFRATYGAVDNTQFVTLLYRNVLDREPDAGGLQYHLGEFARGETRAQMLIHFSESPENQANVIGDIANGMVYIWSN